MSTPILMLLPFFGCACMGVSIEPPGESKETKPVVLETGSQMLQSNDPAEELAIYLIGFHPLKEDPSKQIEAHHFCKQVNKDFAQCALFDGNTDQANLNGIEYIISENLYEQLPEEEKQYWHPHNYEIISGHLVAPGLPAVAERELMVGKMNSYGKTWHVWNTGHYGMKGDRLPLGKPMLAWSFNRDGEALPGLVEKRDQQLDIRTSEIRKNREDLIKLAKPQGGVDAIVHDFKGPTVSPYGIVDKKIAEDQPRQPASVREE